MKKFLCGVRSTCLNVLLHKTRPHSSDLLYMSKVRDLGIVLNPGVIYIMYI